METKNFLNSENTVREAYEAPKCEIIEIQNEGVLCLSDGYSNPGVERSTDSYGW